MIQRFQKTNTGRNEKGRSVKIGQERIAFATDGSPDNSIIVEDSFKTQGESHYV